MLTALKWLLSSPSILASVAAAVAVVIYALSRGRKHCPKCNYKLPMIRRPSTEQQALWGGWTCPICGANIDRDGNYQD